MGRDKTRLERDGVPWSLRAARLLDRLFEETLLVGGMPAPESPGIRIPDVEGPASAMRGVTTALAAASAERVLVLATDLPLLPAELLLALTAWPEHDAIVPVDPCGEQPLCAIYRRDRCLEAARACLDSGRLSLRAWLDELDTSRVPLARLGFEESGLLSNINTPEELARLEGL